MTQARFKQSGFTLVETVIITPIMVVMTAVVITFIVAIFATISRNIAILNMRNDAELALFTIRDDVYLARGYMATPAAIDPHKTEGWDASSEKALIVQEVSFTLAKQNDAREAIFIPNATTSCENAAIGANDFATNNLIYFVNQNNLYQRTLIPDQGACATTYRKQTCPEGTEDCVADRIIAQNVSDFEITYYATSASGATPFVTSDMTLEDFESVTRVDIKLTLEKMVRGEPEKASASISLRRAN